MTNKRKAVKSREAKKAEKQEKQRKAEKPREAGQQEKAEMQRSRESSEVGNQKSKTISKSGKTYQNIHQAKAGCRCVKKKCGCMWLAGWHVEIKKYVINKNTHIYIYVYT
jgi:hypothetical protein